MSTPTNTTILPLMQEHIPFGMQLKDMAGWNQLPVDWERFIQWEPQGCFLALSEGERAGTAITINYDNRFGWVGMVLVHPDQRRKGIGTKLLMVCIEYLESSGVGAVKLDATPMGKQLYDTIGFVDEYMVERHQVRAASRGEQTGVEALTESHLHAIAPIDLEAFGADRTRVLARLQSEEQTDAFVAFGPSGPDGYIFVRPGMNADYIGPWVATSTDVATRLLGQALDARAGRDVLIDVSLANESAPQIIADHGFTKQRHLIRMYRGSNDYPGRAELVYSVTGPEVG